MRQTVAKRIRKAVYGDNASTLEARKYHRSPDTGSVQADPSRKRYQQLKREHIQMRGSSI